MPMLVSNLLFSLWPILIIPASTTLADKQMDLSVILKTPVADGAVPHTYVEYLLTADSC